MAGVRRLGVAVLMMGLSALSGPVAASVNIRGSLAAAVVQANESLHDGKGAVGLRGRLEVDTLLAPFLSARFRVERDSDRNFGVTGSDQWLREAVFRYRHDLFDLSVGKQLLPAGRTDLITLQDQFAPRDLSLQTMSEAEQRLGVNAARLDLYPDNVWTLTGVLVQRTVAHQLPLGSAISSMPGRVGNTAGGGVLRTEYRQGAWEWAAGFSWGGAPLPALSPEAGNQAWSVVFPRERRWSMDGTLTLADGVLRWDFVHARRERHDQLPGLPRLRWALAVGFDRPLWHDATLTAQWIHRREQGLDGGGVYTRLATLNQQLSQGFQASQQWLTVSLRQSLGAQHDLEGVLILGQARQRGFIGRWNWRVRDNWTVGVRVQSLSGRDLSLLGSLKPQRQLYVEVRRHADWRAGGAASAD